MTSMASKSAGYTKPELRERIKSRVMASGDGGKPGQWSARKAQLVAQKYESAGGGYSGAKTEGQKSLSKWTDQKWTTSDGKPAERKGGTTRYLPEKAWDKLSPGERAATNAKKREGSRKGEQFVKNTEAAAEARKEAFEKESETRWARELREGSPDVVAAIRERMPKKLVDALAAQPRGGAREATPLADDIVIARGRVAAYAGTKPPAWQTRTSPATWRLRGRVTAPSAPFSAPQPADTLMNEARETLSAAPAPVMVSIPEYVPAGSSASTPARAASGHNLLKGLAATAALLGTAYGVKKLHDHFSAEKEDESMDKTAMTPAEIRELLQGKTMGDFLVRQNYASNILRHGALGSALGSAVGAGLGAYNADEGSRLSGALRGAGRGALAGGALGTTAGVVKGGLTHRALNNRKPQWTNEFKDFLREPTVRQEDRNFISRTELIDDALEFIRPSLMAEIVANAKEASEGGAWQRSEGKNPEGGLNAKGRASLKAQGHDIKPGVKGPADTPEKMKRKGSFLSRMFGPGAPGSMKKDNGEPSRRALSAKAWGEPVPSDDAGRARLYAKGQALLKKYKGSEKSAEIAEQAVQAVLARYGFAKQAAAPGAITRFFAGANPQQTLSRMGFLHGAAIGTPLGAAIGTGVGAIRGAYNAEEGHRLSGALKGGLKGGVVGGTVGGLAAGAGLRHAFLNEGGGLPEEYRQRLLNEGVGAALREGPLGALVDAARYKLKIASIDPKLLTTAMPSAQLGETPGTLEFKTPGGHTVVSPYTDEVIKHHIKRLGGQKAYYEHLGRTLSDLGVNTDRDIELSRDKRVKQQRAANTFVGANLGGLLGGFGGIAVGHSLKRPGLGALIGTTLGTVGGGLIGRGRNVTRESGPTIQYTEDVPELYKEPEHVGKLRDNLAAVQNQLDNIELDRYLDHLHYNRPYSSYSSYSPYRPYRPYRPYGLYGSF